MAMQAFQYTKVRDIEGALGAGAAAGVKFIAGGTTLIDLMKLYVEQPTTVVDINSLPMDKIERTADGGLQIGAMVRNSDVAHDATVQQEYPVLAQALLSGASPQLRNMATTGEISCSARAATTFAIPLTPATSALLGRAVRRSMGTTVSMRSWARASIALPRIRRIWRWR
jgi:CO/xanthine dehydrogenase FAD-binding subunit